jgi:hypothetical protein
MSKTPSGELSKREIAARESRVLDHFLTSKPEPHKPLGKTAQAKRRKKEKRAK